MDDDSPTNMLSMNELTTYRWSLDEDLARYTDAGYRSIGVWRQKLADFGEERGVALIAESGLTVSNLQWAGGFTGSDGRSVDDSLRDAEHAVRLAAELNAGCLVVYAGGRNNHTYRHAERLLRSSLDHLLDYAADYDVTLALEPMQAACAKEWTFLTDVESTVAIIESYRTPLLRLALDAYHFGHDRAMLANLREVVRHIAIVHLADRAEPHSLDQNRCPLGAGRLRLGELIRGLVDAGYEGPFDVELIGRDAERRDYRELLRSSRAFYRRVLSPVRGR